MGLLFIHHCLVISKYSVFLYQDTMFRSFVSDPSTVNFSWDKGGMEIKTAHEDIIFSI